MPIQPGNTDPYTDDIQERLDEKADHAKDNHDHQAHTLLPLFARQRVSILDPSRGIWIPGTIWHRLCHRSYLVHTTAGAVYWHTHKHLCERQVNQPNPKPPTADMEISCKVKAHVHAPIQPHVHHAPAGVQPEPAANQCTNPSTQHQCTPAKPTQQLAKTPQHNQSAVQSSTEQKVSAPPSGPAANVPASSSSHSSLATCQSSHTHHATQCLIKQM